MSNSGKVAAVDVQALVVRHARLLLLVALVLGTLAMTVHWAPLSNIIASGDLFPDSLMEPARWFPSAVQVWARTVSLDAELNYYADYALQAVVAWLPRTLGVPFPVVQRAQFALALIGIAWGFFCLPAALRITDNVCDRAVAAFSFAFGAYAVQNSTNILLLLVLFVVVAWPVVYTRLLDSRGWATPSWLCVIVCLAQAQAYIFINPPQEVMSVGLAVALMLWALVVRGVTWRRTGLSALALALVVLASLWWLPAALRTVSGAGVQVTAQTDVFDWAWTHVNASFLNVWDGVGSWAFPQEQYFPWNSAYLTPLTQTLLLWPLATSGMALLLARRTPRLAVPALLCATAALGSAFLAKGLHAPLTGENAWIYTHMPGMFLFREPVTKFGLSLTLFASLSLVVVLTQVRELAPPWATGVLWAARAGVVAALLVISWPMLSGATVPAASQMPGNPVHRGVQIPAYWFAMASYMRTLPDHDGYALLPNEDYYQQQYTWGYYGVDLLPMAIIDRPELFLADSSAGYTSTSPARDAYIRAIVTNLHAGQMQTFARDVGELGVRYVLLRRDVVPLGGDRQTIDPTELSVRLATTPGITPVTTIGQLELFRIDADLVRPQVSALPAASVAVQTAPDLPAVSSASLAGGVLASTAAPATCASSATPAATTSVAVLSDDWRGYTVRVTVGAKPVLLVLNQAYNSNWRATVISAPPASATCPASTPQHVTVNGISNGWWLSNPGTYVVRLAFAGLNQTLAAYAISGSVLLVSVLWLLGRLIAWLVMSPPLPFWGKGRGSGTISN